MAFICNNAGLTLSKYYNGKLKTFINDFSTRLLFVYSVKLRSLESLWCFLQKLAKTCIVDFEYSMSKFFLIG